MIKNILTKLLLFFCAGLCASEIYLLDNFEDSKDWGLNLGGEFPGAIAQLRNDESKKLALFYDFSKGGRYITIFPRFAVPENFEKLCLELAAEQKCRINYRIVDSTGRYFQGKAVTIDSGASKLVEFSPKGPWSGSWGGKKNAMPKKPFKQFYIMVLASKDLPKKGVLNLKKFELLAKSNAKSDFVGQGSQLNCGGWQVKAEWLPQLAGALLKISAKNNASRQAELSVNFPEMGRDKVWRRKLSGSSATFLYRPLGNKTGNIYNKYVLILNVKDALGNQAKCPLVLAGRKSNEVNFGKKVSASQIKHSRFGVCTHFSFGKSKAFAYWKPYKVLIDGISECGYKWIRDECSVIKADNGKYKVSDYDLRWMKYAKEKGINIILCVRMYPDKSIDEYKKYMEAVVGDTREYVEVYELGNEPGNFGWRKKMGGHWNGYDPKTKKLDKWVVEHLKYTNTLADHIKKVFPKTRIIGVGAASPTNFLVLKKGVTKSLEGIVDHPYTYSLPPEKVPFSKGHLKRDGIVVSVNGSFRELVESYEKLFKGLGRKSTLWLTEFGYPCFWFDGKNEKGLYAGFTEEAQAVYLLRRFIYGMAMPIVAVSIQYDYLDDYKGKVNNAEANFGIIRTDHSRKPAYYAIQRLNSVFNGYKFSKKTKIIVEKQPLHRSCVRGVLVKSWDKAAIKASNEVKAFGFYHPELKTQKMIAVWSSQPYSREFNNRVCTLRIKNAAEYDQQPLAIDLITGRSYDIPYKKDGKDIVIYNLVLKGHPIVIKLFK